MNHEFAKQFDNVLRGVEIRMPPQVAELVADNLNKARSAYETAIEGWKNYGEQVATLAQHQQAAAQDLNNRAISNATTNVTAALEAAQALAKTKSMQDAFKIQAEFGKAQSERLVAQTQDMVSLMSKMNSDALAAWSSAFQVAMKR
jgi:hypothetical protein